MHLENIPAGFWALPVGALVVLALVVAVQRRRMRSIRNARVDRRRKSIARQQAWDWLMRRNKHQRLTDQRNNDEDLFQQG